MTFRSAARAIADRFQDRRLLVFAALHLTSIALVRAAYFHSLTIKGKHAAFAGPAVVYPYTIGITIAAGFMYFFLSPVIWQFGKPLKWLADITIKGMVLFLAYHAVLIWLDYDLFSRLFPGATPPTPAWGDFARMTIFSMLIGHIIHTREQHESARLRAEIGQLKARLSPHALSGFLNQIAELTHSDPRRGERAILALGSFLNALRRVADRQHHSLAEVRALMETHLALDNLLVDDLRVSWEWPAELADRQVPPLLVLPLLENALQHGIIPAGGGSVVFRAGLDGTHLVLEVRNTGEPPQNKKDSSMHGEGLFNLRQRLSMLYKDKASCRMVRVGDWTIATVRVPIE